MKKLIQISCLILVTFMIASCSSTKKRAVASERCSDKYFVDEYSHFDKYETCNDY